VAGPNQTNQDGEMNPIRCMGLATAILLLTGLDIHAESACERACNDVARRCQVRQPIKDPQIADAPEPAAVRSMRMRACAADLDRCKRGCQNPSLLQGVAGSNECLAVSSPHQVPNPDTSCGHGSPEFWVVVSHTHAANCAPQMLFTFENLRPPTRHGPIEVPNTIQTCLNAPTNVRAAGVQHGVGPAGGCAVLGNPKPVVCPGLSNAKDCRCMVVTNACTRSIAVHYTLIGNATLSDNLEVGPRGRDDVSVCTKAPGESIQYNGWTLK
jgi:hypothetical protein